MLEIREIESGITIRIRVKTRAKENALVGVRGDSLLVSVTAVPEKGRANKAIIDLVAKHLKIPKRDVEILSGQTNARKVILIRQLDQKDLMGKLELEDLSR